MWTTKYPRARALTLCSVVALIVAGIVLVSRTPHGGPGSAG